MSRAFSEVRRSSVRSDPGAGVERLESFFRHGQLGSAHVGRGVKHLSLEVRKIDGIEIDEADLSYAGGRQIERGRSAEPSRSNQQHLRMSKLSLPRDPDLREQQVTTVSAQLVAGEGLLGSRRDSDQLTVGRGRPSRGRSTPGDGGDDRDHVPVLQRGRLAVKVSDVFIVEVHRHEVPGVAPRA